MNVGELLRSLMNDEQKKSLALAKLLGWTISPGGFMFSPGDPMENEDDRWYSTLYDPSNMALAWRVLEWAANQRGGREWSEYPNGWFYIDVIMNNFDLEELAFKGKKAQAAWLDLIYELAIDVGDIKWES